MCGFELSVFDKTLPVKNAERIRFMAYEERSVPNIEKRVPKTIQRFLSAIVLPVRVEATVLYL